MHSCQLPCHHVERDTCIPPGTEHCSARVTKLILLARTIPDALPLSTKIFAMFPTSNKEEEGTFLLGDEMPADPDECLTKASKRIPLILTTLTHTHRVNIDKHS